MAIRLFYYNQYRYSFFSSLSPSVFILQSCFFFNRDFADQRQMLWKSILTNFFTAENTKILSKTALESTEFTKLNQYKA